MEKRIYRIGQEKECEIVTLLVAKDDIEQLCIEKLDDLERATKLILLFKKNASEDAKEVRDSANEDGAEGGTIA